MFFELGLTPAQTRAPKGVPFGIPTFKLSLPPRLAGFGSPLKDYAAKHGQTWLPQKCSLAEFKEPPLHSAFCSVR